MQSDKENKAHHPEMKYTLIDIEHDREHWRLRIGRAMVVLLIAVTLIATGYTRSGVEKLLLWLMAHL
jgi:hypothetical protein